MNTSVRTELAALTTDRPRRPIRACPCRVPRQSYPHSPVPPTSPQKTTPNGPPVDGGGVEGSRRRVV